MHEPLDIGLAEVQHFLLTWLSEEHKHFMLMHDARSLYLSRRRRVSHGH
jgi:hypothetical protein